MVLLSIVIGISFLFLIFVIYTLIQMAIISEKTQVALYSEDQFYRLAFE
ncbi:hypothetical protein [Euhalothece natronophila]|nr:hypothetical protein [Euhalothece natronophila]